jgi:uncharacterized protein (DUF1697 family)
MRWVAFLRAANVGTRNRFQPAVLAKELTGFGVVNIGAVGTFIVREDVTEATLRAELARKLPFKCEVMICPAKAILDLAQEDPFVGERRDNCRSICDGNGKSADQRSEVSDLRASQRKVGS